MTDSTLALAEQLNSEYKAGLVVLSREDGKYDVGMLDGASMKNLFTDVNDEFLQAWLHGALFGANVGKAQAPAEASEPNSYTGMIMAGQSETIIPGAHGTALIVEAYSAVMGTTFNYIPGYVRTNGGDLKVFFDSPVEENVMIRVLEL